MTNHLKEHFNLDGGVASRFKTLVRLGRLTYPASEAFFHPLAFPVMEFRFVQLALERYQNFWDGL